MVLCLRVRAPVYTQYMRYTYNAMAFEWRLLNFIYCQAEMTVYIRVSLNTPTGQFMVFHINPWGNHSKRMKPRGPLCCADNDEFTVISTFFDGIIFVTVGYLIGV